MQFNIALVPQAIDISSTLIDLADYVSMTQQLTTHYQLQQPTQGSIPHVSVFQLRTKQTASDLTALLRHEFNSDKQLQQVTQQGVTCKLGNRISYRPSAHRPNITWVSLDLDRALNPQIFSLHEEIYARLQPLKMKPCNSSLQHYLPHFTLCNFSERGSAALVNTIPAEYYNHLRSIPLKLILGVANHHWELTEVVYTF